MPKLTRERKLIIGALCGSAPFIVLAVTGVVPTFVFEVYVISVATYGYVFYVEGQAGFSQKWIWKALAPLTGVHVALLAGYFFWERLPFPSKLEPLLGPLGLLITILLDIVSMGLILDALRPKTSDG